MDGHLIFRKSWPQKHDMILIPVAVCFLLATWAIGLTGFLIFWGCLLIGVYALLFLNTPLSLDITNNDWIVTFPFNKKYKILKDFYASQYDLSTLRGREIFIFCEVQPIGQKKRCTARLNLCTFNGWENLHARFNQFLKMDTFPKKYDPQSITLQTQKTIFRTHKPGYFGITFRFLTFLFLAWCCYIGFSYYFQSLQVPLTLIFGTFAFIFLIMLLRLPIWWKADPTVYFKLDSTHLTCESLLPGLNHNLKLQDIGYYRRIYLRGSEMLALYDLQGKYSFLILHSSGTRELMDWLSHQYELHPLAKSLWLYSDLIE